MEKFLLDVANFIYDRNILFTIGPVLVLQVIIDIIEHKKGKRDTYWLATLICFCGLGVGAIYFIFLDFSMQESVRHSMFSFALSYIIYNLKIGKKIKKKIEDRIKHKCKKC